MTGRWLLTHSWHSDFKRPVAEPTAVTTVTTGFGSWVAAALFVAVGLPAWRCSGHPAVQLGSQTGSSLRFAR